MDTSVLPRILLVDDLALVRRMIPMRLGELRDQIDCAASAEDARDYLARRRPVLILLDVVMPGTDGLSFCRELKTDAATRDIPVVILTDLKGTAHERSLEAGADDYLPKRIADPVFRIRVRLHMQLQELRRQSEPLVPGPSSILLATSPALGAQFSAQLSKDGHTCRMVGGFGEIAAAAQPSDRLLVVEHGLDPGALPSVLQQLRSNPATAGMPVLVVSEKETLESLDAVEYFIDDVIWKPLAAQVTRHRLGILLELARRTYGD